MATVREIGILPVPFVASEDLSAKQYHFVELAGSGTSSVGKVRLRDSASATYAAYGVLQNDPESGEEATVMTWPGFTKVKCVAPGTRVLVGHWLAANSSGTAVVTTVASLAAAVAMENGDTAASCYIQVQLRQQDQTQRNTT